MQPKQIWSVIGVADFSARQVSLLQFFYWSSEGETVTKPVSKLNSKSQAPNSKQIPNYKFQTITTVHSKRLTTPLSLNKGY